MFCFIFLLGQNIHGTELMAALCNTVIQFLTSSTFRTVLRMN